MKSRVCKVISDAGPVGRVAPVRMRALGGGVRRERCGMAAGRIGSAVSVSESETWDDERRPPRLPESLHCRVLEDSPTPPWSGDCQFFRDAMKRYFLCDFSE